MKHIFLLITITLFISCGKDKAVILPEISHSDISEIQDVSAAYIFYDETKPDSTELNRKNLISTTNWLINVDKRLTLKQVIPHIKFLQEKKVNSSHKNPNAKNYFTCHDTSKNSLGFLEFTKIAYRFIEVKQGSIPLRPPMTKEESKKQFKNIGFQTLPVTINNDKSIIFHDELFDLNQLQKKLRIVQERYNFIGINLEFYFNKNLKFQDYIWIKTKLKILLSDLITFNNIEYIY